MRHGSLLERLDHRGGERRIDEIAERGEHRLTQQVLEHRPLTAVLEGLDLDLADRGGRESIEIVDPRHRLRLSAAQRATQRVRRERLVVRNAEANTHTAPLIHTWLLERARCD